MKTVNSIFHRANTPTPADTTPTAPAPTNQEY